jgi:hypothetical protein
MKSKQENRERIARNVRNFRERKAREGYVRLELYLSPEQIDSVFDALGPDGHVYGPAGAVVKLLGTISKSDDKPNIHQQC